MALNGGYDMSSFTVARLPRGRNKPDALPVKGKVTVVELWATWCEPCTNLIPHLSSLQLEFSEDLDIVGFTGEEEDKGFEYVQNFCRSKGDKLQYPVLSLNKGSELPVHFRDFETYPHAIVYDKNGTLIYKGSPTATQFEETLRRSLHSNFTRRAVFLQALNLPKTDNLSQSDPFCAIFVKPVNSENGNWAMCGFGPYFPGQSIPPHKAHLTSQKSKDKERGQLIGKSYVPKEDPDTLRNQMMTTEVIRDRNDAVWSNYFVVDSANYPGEWEVLFAVYDHDCSASLSKWQERKVSAQRRCVRVFAEYNDLKPADFKDGRSFFVTDDMIQNPSDKLFRGKHELIGKVKAKLHEALFQPNKYFCSAIPGWQTASKSTEQPVFKIHSYEFVTMGSPYTFSIKAKLAKRFFEKKRTPALFAFTPLAHCRSTLRLLYNDVHCADSTYDPDFPSFVLNPTEDQHRNVFFSTSNEGDQDGGQALSCAEITFILRDIDDTSDQHEVGAEIGRYTTTIDEAKTHMTGNSMRNVEGNVKQRNRSCWLDPPRQLKSEVSPVILSENNNGTITYLSCAPTNIGDRCAKNSSFFTAAQDYRKLIINALSAKETTICNHEFCPNHAKAGRCLNLENMGLHDGDLEEIFSIVYCDESDASDEYAFDTDTQDTQRKLIDIRTRWRDEVGCVNLNGNSLEFNLNFWSIKWPIHMTSLHLDGNRIKISGWAKVFFSLAKWISSTTTKKVRDEHWPLRFFEISERACVFSDSLPSEGTTKHGKPQHFPHKRVSPKDASSNSSEHEAAVEFLNSFIKLVAGHLFKSSRYDDIARYLSNEVFERSLVLDQYVLFQCIRNLLWQIDTGIQAIHSEEKLLHNEEIIVTTEPEGCFQKMWHDLKKSDLFKNVKPRLMNFIGLLVLLYGAANSCLLIFFVPQLCGGRDECSFDDHLNDLETVTNDHVSRWSPRIWALIVNFVSLAVVSLTLIFVAWREDSLIVDLDAVSTLPNNQVQAVLMWNTPASIGKNVKKKRRYDEEIGGLKRKHEKLHRRLLYLAIVSELIFIANFIFSGYVVMNRAVNYLTYVNYFSQLVTMSILLFGLALNVWTDNAEGNFTRTMLLSQRQMYNMLDPKLIKPEHWEQEQPPADQELDTV